MKNYLDKLNLRPQERRLVVAVLLVIFILLNMWFIWPRFGDWRETNDKMDRNRTTLKKYEDEIARRNQYERQLEELKKTGSEMLSDELQLQRIVQTTANASSFQINNIDPRVRSNTGTTNQFFQEQTLAITFTSGGKELVDFLVNLASENAMIRVREMNIKPDPSHTKLAGNLVLVANYQRKTAPDKAAAPRKKS